MAEKPVRKEPPMPPFTYESGKPEPEEKPSPPKPPEEPDFAPRPPMPKPLKPAIPAREPGKAEYPPLFIKVDKYREILQSIQQLRSYALGLRDALDAITDIEKELKVGMEIAHKALDRLNMIMSALDSKLLRVQGMESEEPEPPKDMEKYIDNVYKQMERIKDELKTIS